MLLNELFEVSRDLVGRYKTAAIKDVDRAIAAKAAGALGRDEYERKMTKRGRGTAAAQRRLTPQGTRLDLTPYGDAIQRDYDRYRTDEQGMAEGFKNIYAEFSGYGNYMQGRAINVFNKAGLEIVSKDYTEDDDIQTYVVKGDRQAIEKAGEFLERNAEQFGGYHFVKQGVAEGRTK